ncbi:MAG: hypothetical protein IPK59_07435 [Rhodospirillaceae bacterium]|nr:hypothetical protein [Rhodospirillaceae bacterium]
MLLWADETRHWAEKAVIMSITMLNALSSAATFDLSKEKDAQQKALESGEASDFATALAGVTVPSDTTLVSGQRGNAVIPAILIEVEAANPAAAKSALIVSDAGQSTSVADQFLDFARKTPAEKMRAMVLAEMGLSEDALRSLDAETRAEIEAKIRIRVEAKVRQGIEENSGMKLGQPALSLLPA